MYIEEYRYNNAIIRVRGEVKREKVEEAAIIFLKKAERCRKNKAKEKGQNGNSNKS
jgi:hypothetical protein